MIVKSDWHIHTEHSYDAKLPLQDIAESARKIGLKSIGISDHVNLNDRQFLGFLKASSENVKQMQKTYPEIVMGVELTPIDKPQFEYVAKHGTNQGFVSPAVDPYAEFELAGTKEELMSYGVKYAVGGVHWRFGASYDDSEGMKKEWYRQMMWLANDERVTILAHPWWNSPGVWYDDFSQIPRSMNTELAAALKENKKYVECNEFMITTPAATEKFKRQYAEFIRELFEMGIPVTYGSDSHSVYAKNIADAEKILSQVGFVEGDFSDLDEKDFWF